jgi:hypothetical protein
MVNPPFSGTFSNFKVEIMDGVSSFSLQSTPIYGNIIINPGTLSVSYVAPNRFRLAKAVYAF